MKTKIVLLGALLAATAGYLGACVDQPNAGCPIQSPYWVKYTVVDAGEGGCGNKPGELIGFQMYNTPGTKGSTLAFRPDGIGTDWANGRVDPADPEGKKINGFAKMAEFPAADHYCDVTGFTPPDESFPKGDDVALDDGGIEPGAPAVHKRYDWESLRVLATVNAPGTIFKGQLKYTENNCVAILDTFGIWGLSEYTGGNPSCDPAFNTDTFYKKGKGYNLDCDPKPVTVADYTDALADGGLPDGGEPILSHYLGSGINPTFATETKPITCGEGGFCEPQLTADEIAKL